MKTVYLRITTWDGYDPKASHYYGSLTDRDTVINITEKLERGETQRIRSKERLLELAKEAWQKHFPKADILVEGDTHYLEPQRILEIKDPSLEDYKNKINKLAQTIEDNYDCHGDWIDEKVYTDACDKWEKLTEEIDG